MAKAKEVYNKSMHNVNKDKKPAEADCTQLELFKKGKAINTHQALQDAHAKIKLAAINLEVNIVNPCIFLFTNLNSPNIFLCQLVQELFDAISVQILVKVASIAFDVVQKVLTA